MSDEQPPASLRLRPRVVPPANGNSEPEAPVSPPEPTPAPPTEEPVIPQDPTLVETTRPAEESSASDAPAVSDAALTDPFRLRLKPKAAPPEGLSVETPLPFSNPPIPPAPVEAPITPQSGVAPVSPVPPPVWAPPPPRFQSPKPTAPVAPPGPIHLPTPRTVTEPMPPPSSPGVSSPTIKADKWLAGVVVLLLIIGGTVYGIRYISAHPKPKPVGRAQAAPKPAEAAPSAPQNPAEPVSNRPHLVDHPVSAAGKTIAQARDVVAAHDRRELEEGASSVLAEPSAAPNVQPATSSPANSSTGIVASAPSAPVVEEPVAKKDEPPPPPPSDAFRQFVINMRVNGVFQGENARAMLNGKMYHVGDVVEPKLGISLFKVEPEAKQLVFKDGDGAIMSRRY